MAAAVTLGAQGAFFLSADESCLQPAFPVTAIDTVAAGDAFNGTLAATTTDAQDSMPTRAAVDRLLTAA